MDCCTPYAGADKSRCSFILLLSKWFCLVRTSVTFAEVVIISKELGSEQTLRLQKDVLTPPEFPVPSQIAASEMRRLSLKTDSTAAVATAYASTDFQCRSCRGSHLFFSEELLFCCEHSFQVFCEDRKSFWWKELEEEAMTKLLKFGKEIFNMGGTEPFQAWWASKRLDNGFILGWKCAEDEHVFIWNPYSYEP